MMKRTCITVFIFCLFIVNLFAEHAEFKAIKELEQIEKTPPPERIARPKVEYKAGGLRDPFQRFEPGMGHKTTAEQSKISETPEKQAQAALSSLTVQGLIWGGRFPQAIINNKVLKIGDTIDKVSIINIDKDGVTVSFEETEYRLPSPAAGVKPFKKP